MSTIVTRVGKGSPLTWTEVDSNFTNLNTDKIQSGNTVSALTITTATINGGTITGITDLAVADGGTGLSSLTAGYIPFGADTSAFGSSSNLFWDSANNRLGIGTATPSVKLSVYDATNCVIQSNSDAVSQIVAVRYSNDTVTSNIIARKARGTFASPSVVNSGDTAGLFTAQVFAGTNNRPVGQMSAIVDTYTSDTNVSGFLTFNTNGGSTNVTERMRITSAGNVGIGTTSITYRLDVNGVIRSSTSTNGGSVVVGNNLNSTLGTFGVANGSSTVAINNNGGNFPISLQQGGVDKLFIDTSGNVGIGTSSPSSLLNIYSATISQLTISGDSITAAVINRNSTDATQPSIVLRKARGTTASPAAVNSGDALGALTLQGFGGTNNRVLASIFGYVNTYTSDTDISSYLVFNTSPSGSVAAQERMRIHASGGVSIGNTTDSGAASLNVSGSMSGGYIAHAAGTTAMAFGADNVVRVTPNATATYTTTVPAAGAICVLSILTSGATSYTITFGTGFKSTGTLATGTTTARYFNITFVSDGTNLIEMSRTVAIA